MHTFDRNAYNTSKLPRYLLVALCAMCLGTSYCDRVNLSVAIVPMAEEYNWDINEKGKLLSGFFYGYLLSQIFGAVLSRKIGGEVVLVVAAFFWNLFTLLVPIAASFGTTTLFIDRMLVGIFEGVSFPVVYHLLALNIPENERSRSIGILSVNISFGAVFAFFLSPIIISRYNWESVFYFFGMLGMFWCLLWMLFWRYNSRVGFTSDNYAEHGQTNFKLQTKGSATPGARGLTVRQELNKTGREILKLCQYKVVLAVLYCHFCHNIGHYVILSWLPTFLSNLGVEGENLSITCIPYILMAIFAVLFGSSADKMMAKGSKSDDVFVSSVRRFWTVRLFSAAGFCLILLTFFTENPKHIVFVIIFLSLALGLNTSCPVAGYESAKLDLIEKNKVGILQGLSNSFATLSGVIGVPIVSLIHTAFDSWTPVFWWIAFMFFSAAYAFHVFGRWKEKISI